MKLLKWLAALLLLIIAGFFSIGLLNPSFQYTTQTEISAPVEIVWALYMDRDRLTEWVADIESMKLIEGVNGEEGSVTEFVFLMDGTRVVMRETITDVETEGLIAYDMRGEDLVTQTNLVFQKTGPASTTLISYNDVQPVGLLNKSIFYLFRDHFKEQEQLQYIKFAQLCESRRR